MRCVTVALNTGELLALDVFAPPEAVAELLLAGGFRPLLEDVSRCGPERSAQGAGIFSGQGDHLDDCCLTETGIAVMVPDLNDGVSALAVNADWRSAGTAA